MQFSADKSKLSDDAPEFDFERTGTEVKAQMEAVRAHFLENLSPQNRRLLSNSLFDMDGGLRTSKETFDRFAPNYFRRSRRVVEYGGGVHLRGTRYTISANPTFELRQKLLHFREDLDEAIEAIQETRNPFFQLAIADYAKNSVMTMFNSFLHEEKQGKYRFDQVNYQAIRREGQVYAQASVDFFYGVLLQAQNLSNSGFKILCDKRKTFDKLQEHILDEYQRGVFSSRHITRREASHPLVIASAVAHFARFGNKKTDCIVGLPSGSTELALAHATGQRFVNRRLCNVLLVPVSLHSAKQEFDSHQLEASDLVRWAKHHRKEINNKQVLIVDDNSSTGRTIQFIADCVKTARPRKLEVAVAEADLHRSQLDRHNPERRNVAVRSLYKHSVGVLAVSKSLRPKSDLKEIYEKKKMLSCVRRRYIGEQRGLSTNIVGKVYCDLLECPTEDVLKSVPPTAIIRKFRKTFLSNFHPKTVMISGQTYESVEHAYQAMKFAPGTWEKITESDVDAINRKLQPRGATVTRHDLPDLFVNPSITAGTSKIAANYLRILGYVREDWDDVKVPIMTDLLIQKFSDPDLNQRLKETGENYLMEGNDWNDTFWGECEGRGRNVLGRMLMVIRDTELSTLVRTAKEIRLRNSPSSGTNRA